MTIRYRHSTDAIREEILPLLDNPAAYDLDAILDEAFTYVVEHDHLGNPIEGTGGWEDATGGEPELWVICERHRVQVEVAA